VAEAEEGRAEQAQGKPTAGKPTAVGNWPGILDYARQRSAALTPDEKRRLLACAAYRFAHPIFRYHYYDEKNKYGYYTVYEVKSGLGLLGVASAGKGMFVVRGLPVGEAIALTRASSCLRNFRRPITMFQSVVGLPAAVAHFTVEYAWDRVKWLEASLQLEASLLARIHYRLRRGKYAWAAREDPLAVALGRCWRGVVELAGWWAWARDAVAAVEAEEPLVVLADGEPSHSPIRSYATADCPLRTLTIFNVDAGYLAHAVDAV